MQSQQTRDHEYIVYKIVVVVVVLVGDVVRNNLCKHVCVCVCV